MFRANMMMVLRPTVRNSNSYNGHISFIVVTLTILSHSISLASSNYDTSMVERLLTDRDTLIQDGLSYFNGTTLRDVKR